jgi:hypothetical protein
MTEPEALREYASFSGTPIEMREVLLSSANRIEKLEAALKKIALDDPDCCMIADRMRETAEIALGLKND